MSGNVPQQGRSAHSVHGRAVGSEGRRGRWGTPPMEVLAYAGSITQNLEEVRESRHPLSGNVPQQGPSEDSFHLAGRPRCSPMLRVSTTSRKSRRGCARRIFLSSHTPSHISLFVHTSPSLYIYISLTHRHTFTHLPLSVHTSFSLYIHTSLSLTQTHTHLSFYTSLSHTHTHTFHTVRTGRIPDRLLGERRRRRTAARG